MHVSFIHQQPSAHLRQFCVYYYILYCGRVIMTPDVKWSNVVEYTFCGRDEQQAIVTLYFYLLLGVPGRQHGASGCVNGSGWGFSYD